LKRVLSRIPFLTEGPLPAGKKKKPGLAFRQKGRGRRLRKRVMLSGRLFNAVEEMWIAAEMEINENRKKGACQLLRKENNP